MTHPLKSPKSVFIYNSDPISFLATIPYPIPHKPHFHGWGVGGATYFHGGPLQITFEYPPEGWVFIYKYPQWETPSNLALTTHSGKRQAHPHDSCTHLYTHPKGGYSSIITHNGKCQAI